MIHKPKDQNPIKKLEMMLQVEYIAERLLKWVKVGGHIFFRESCFHQSGDHKRKSNPTHYREPRFYTKVQLYSSQIM